MILFSVLRTKNIHLASFVEELMLEVKGILFLKKENPLFPV